MLNESSSLTITTITSLRSNSCEKNTGGKLSNMDRNASYTVVTTQQHHNLHTATYSQYSGYAHLGAGLTVGLSSLAAGLAIGIVGDSGVRANAQQPKLFVGMILILIFATKQQL
mmetsp:Transcript_16402/g.13909  ORF Transcript_16402/g.13909 Transcript_16402/m.13909 type:complete len:114 (+) Transcript_16402:219-560(+)